MIKPLLVLRTALGLIVLGGVIGFERLNSSFVARTYSEDRHLAPRSVAIFDGMSVSTGVLGAAALLLLIATFVFAPTAKRFARAFATSPRRVSWVLTLTYGTVFLALAAISILSVVR